MKAQNILLLAFLSLAIVNCSSSQKEANTDPEFGGNGSEQADFVESAGDDPFAELDRIEGGNEGFTEAESATFEALDSAEPGMTASSVGAGAMSGAMSSYTVKRGDTLMKIAFNVYGNVNRWRDIFQANKDKLHKAGKIEPGMVLVYDAPSTPFVRNALPYSYLIKKGDTLGTISSDVYGKKSKWKKLYNYNRDLIQDPNKIYAGFSLYYDITPKELEEAKQLKNKLSEDNKTSSDDNALSALSPSEATESVGSTTKLAVAPTPVAATGISK